MTAKKKTRRVHPVLIIWNDITADSEWREKGEVHDVGPSEAWTVAWLMEKDKECYRVASTVIPKDGGAGNVWAIPLGAVKSIQRIKL